MINYSQTSEIDGSSYTRASKTVVNTRAYLCVNNIKVIVSLSARGFQVVFFVRTAVYCMPVFTSGV